MHPYIFATENVINITGSCIEYKELVVVSHINMPYSLKALFNYKLMFLEPNGVSLLLNPLF